MITLNYHKLDSESPIRLMFKNLYCMCEWLILQPYGKVVYVFGHTNNETLDCHEGAIIITEYTLNITDSFFDEEDEHEQFNTLFLQEYKDYKTAYKVASDMREGNPLYTV